MYRTILYWNCSCMYLNRCFSRIVPFNMAGTMLIKTEQNQEEITDIYLPSFLEFVEVFNFFLVVKTELLKRWCPSFAIFRMYFAADCFGFQSDLYSGYTSATCSLCIQPVFQDIFKFRPPALVSPESFSWLLALHELFPLPPRTPHHSFIDAKLACSSAVFFLDSKLDGLQLKTCIIWTSSCGFHDEGARTLKIITS